VPERRVVGVFLCGGGAICGISTSRVRDFSYENARMTGLMLRTPLTTWLMTLTTRRHPASHASAWQHWLAGQARRVKVSEPVDLAGAQTGGKGAAGEA
jgi:hypothetical protein